jgi:histidine phosphotransferase ChpT
MNRSIQSSIFADDADQTLLPPRPAATSSVVDMRILELLTSRLCHEMSGPIAAVNNGIELLAEEEGEFQSDALALVGDSARRASHQLQFYRFAYGFSCGRVMAGAAPPELAARFFDTTRTACDYGESVRLLPLDWQKLACNLLLVGAEALLRGGSLTLTDGPQGLDLQVVGETLFLSPEISAALVLATPVAALTPRTVQAYFTGLLAEALGRRLVHAAEPRRVRLTAVALTG